MCGNSRRRSKLTIVVLAVFCLLLSSLSSLASAAPTGLPLNCWEGYHKYEVTEEAEPGFKPLKLLSRPFDNTDVLNYIRQHTGLTWPQEKALRTVDEWHIQFLKATEVQERRRLALTHTRSTIYANMRAMIEASYGPVGIGNKCEVKGTLGLPVPEPRGSYVQLRTSGSGTVNACVRGAKLFRQADFSTVLTSDIVAVRKNPSKDVCTFDMESRDHPPVVDVDKSFLGDVTSFLLPAVKPPTGSVEFLLWTQAFRQLVFGVKIPAVPLDSQSPSRDVADASAALRKLIESKVPDVTIEISDEEVGFVRREDVDQAFVTSALFRSPQETEEAIHPHLTNMFECLRNLKSGTEEQYVVRDGDSLWRIAKRRYGFGHFQHAIANRNAVSLAIATRLRPGTVLTMPSACIQQSGDTVLVERGDSLWKILERRGRLKQLQQVLQRNPHLSDHRSVYPTQLIRMAD